MIPENLALMAAYLMCSEAAEGRVFNPSEAQACAAIYIQVKLDLLPDVTHESYHHMAPSERAQVNRRGYAALLAWRLAHPDTVIALENEAERKLATLDH